MLLNRVEFALVNNPLRAALQRRFELPRLLKMAGGVKGGSALEVGCGSGVGMELIHELAGASSVDGFDLDPRMIARARRRLEAKGIAERLWVGDGTVIPVADATYDIVFDFGVIHHIPDWRLAVAEIRRVLKPGGLFCAEEVLERGVRHSRFFLEHPKEDRFDGSQFAAVLEQEGFGLLSSKQLLGYFAWFVAERSKVGGESPGECR